MKKRALPRILGIGWLVMILGLTTVWAAGQTPGAAPDAAGAVAMYRPGPKGHFGGAGLTAFNSGGQIFASYGPELVRFDVSTPATPARYSFVTLPGLIGDAAAQNGYVYVADGDLRVVDWRDPLYPYVVANVTTPGNAAYVAVRGNLVIVGEANTNSPFGRLRLYDIQDPASPIFRASYNLGSAVHGLAVAGNYLYVANEAAGLRLFDISIPTAPAPTGSLATSGWAFDVAVSGTHAFVVTSTCMQGCAGNFQVVNVVNPAAPASIAVRPLPVQPQRVTLDDNLAYVANGSGGLTVFDIETPATPLSVASVNLGETGNDVAIASGFAFVATTNGLSTVDIFAPTPVVGSYRSIPSVLAVAAAGSYGYAGGPNAFHVLDVATQSAPVKKGSLTLLDSVYGLEASGTYVYAAVNVLGGLQVIDVNDPAAPFVAGTLNTPGAAHDVLLSGSLAYVADGPAGLLIADVSNPAAPFTVGSLDTPGDAWGVAIAGNYAYVADWDRGLRIIDIQTPGNPVEVGFYDTPGTARRVALLGSYAIVADGAWGLRIIDIQSPTNPVEVANLNTPGSAYDIELVGTTAYVAADTRGFVVVDLNNPLQPNVASQYNSAGQSWSVAAADAAHIYLADRVGAFFVIHNDYRITGTISEANGQPVAGVAVGLNSGGSRLSDPEGNYRFAFMPTGNQIVTPAQSPYVFDPAQSSVNLGPNNAASINFVMLSAPITTTVAPGAAAQLAYLDTQGLPTTLTLPAGAVALTVTVTLAPAYQPDMAGNDFGGHAFLLSVAEEDGTPLPGFLFDLPLTLQIEYSAEDHLGMSESGLALLWTTGGPWLPAETSCTPAGTPTLDLTGNELTLTICADGDYGLFGPPTDVYLPVIQRP